MTKSQTLIIQSLIVCILVIAALVLAGTVDKSQATTATTESVKKESKHD